MKSVTGLILIVVAVFLAAPPASAYLVDLTVWGNSGELATTGDHVTVSISGKTITFTWVSAGFAGMTRGPQDIATAVSLKDIFWDQKVQQSGPAAGAPDYLVEGNPSGQAAGFNPEHGYPTYVTKATLRPSTRSCGGACGESSVLTETFTFAGDLPAGLTASDFVVHVQYRGGGSGFIGGSPGSTAATPAPEPVTMFLGGTGLLALAYAGRKRLFSRFAK